MRRLLSILLVAAVGLYAVLWIGGVVSTALWDDPPEGTGWAAPTFLYMASALIVLRAGRRNATLLLAIGLFGFGAEVLGESTGFPFGDYSYTDALGPALWDVPIALVSAWIVVTVFAVWILQRIDVPRRWWLLAGPLVMVAIDLLLEPVATGPMDAWVWEPAGGYYGVPAMNFFGWFLVSLPIFGLLTAMRYHQTSGGLVSSSVIVFFVLIALVSLLWWPLIITAGAVAAHAFWIRRNGRRSLSQTRFKQPERV